MDLFSTQPGAVVAVPSPGTPMTMFIQGWGDGSSAYIPFKSIITGFSVQTQSGVQFMHTLRDFIYVYVFGERIAPVTINGMCFAHVCERLDEMAPVPGFPGGQSVFFPNYHGLEYVLGFYNTYRVSTLGAPLTLVFGISTVLFGFLVGAQVTMADPENRIVQFSLQFQAIPQATLLDLN